MDRLIAWLEEHLPADDGRHRWCMATIGSTTWCLRRTGPRSSPCSTGNCRRSAIPCRPSLPVHAVALAARSWLRQSRRAGRHRPRGNRHPRGSYVADYCRRRGIGGIAGWNACLAFSFFRLAAICRASTNALLTAMPPIRSAAASTVRRCRSLRGWRSTPSGKARHDELREFLDDHRNGCGPGFRLSPCRTFARGGRKLGTVRSRRRSGRHFRRICGEPIRLPGRRCRRGRDQFHAGRNGDGTLRIARYRLQQCGHRA